MKYHKMTRTLLALCVAGASSAALAQPDIQLRGRVNLDAALVDADKNPELGSGTLFRRGRLGAFGRLSADWDYLIEFDFASGDAVANDVRLRRSLARGNLIIGQVKVPMGLSELASSNNMPFIERSAPSNLVVDARRAGVSYQLSEGPLTLQSMVFSHALNNRSAGNDPVGVAGRVVYNPLRSGSEMLHLGVALAYEERGDDSSLRLRERPESRPADGIRVIDTGDIGQVSSTGKYALELAYQSGPFVAEAEYLQVDIDRRGHADPRFGGYHVQGSYLLTGETRSYGNGVFGGVTPASSSGAWEVAARFSHADLIDRGIVGGEMDSITLAVNYYVTSNLRFMANLIRADVTDGRYGDEKVNSFLLRAHFHF